jgi:hypothetical protein
MAGKKAGRDRQEVPWSLEKKLDGTKLGPSSELFFADDPGAA